MISAGTSEFLAELFEPLGGVFMKRMFGGLGVYRDGLMFAIVVDDILYFKVDGDTLADFEAEGAQRFSYPMRDGRTANLNFWRAPDRLYDEPEDFLLWSRKAVEVARRAEILKAGKPASAPRSKRRAATVTVAK